MTTKFTKLVELKKRKLDNIEVELGKLQNHKVNIEKKIKNLKNNFSKIEKPLKGNFSLMNVSYNSMLQIKQEKEYHEEQLNQINKNIKEVQNQYKNANIEYEKINYLENIEIEKYLKKLAIQEQKEMDDIANILFSRVKENV